MKRRNPYPGVRKNIVKGRIYWRFERVDFRCNLPGPFGSPAFKAAYEAALTGATSPRSTAQPATVAWLIEQYLGSLKFRSLSDSRKRSIRGELDWLRVVAGKYHFAGLGVQHIEAVMQKKTGPTAANTVKKNLSMLYNFASKKLGYLGVNPARFAEKLKTNPDGYHTWTQGEVDQFLHRHGPGTKARLVMLLALNTGMARGDLSRIGRKDLTEKNGELRIAYARGKTSVAADMFVHPDLLVELSALPAEQALLITQNTKPLPYKPESLGNWFRDRCAEAGVPGALHGLRKAGATRLADAGASEWEIASFLAHKDTKQAAVYTKKANRSKLADSGLRKSVNMSNASQKLDADQEKANAKQ